MRLFREVLPHYPLEHGLEGSHLQGEGGATAGCSHGGGRRCGSSSSLGFAGPEEEAVLCVRVIALDGLHPPVTLCAEAGKSLNPGSPTSVGGCRPDIPRGLLDEEMYVCG